MTLYRITAPNGVTYQTEGPPNATPEQVKAVILRAHPEAAGGAKPATAPQVTPQAKQAAQPQMSSEGAQDRQRVLAQIENKKREIAYFQRMVAEKTGDPLTLYSNIAAAQEDIGTLQNQLNYIAQRGKAPPAPTLGTYARQLKEVPSTVYQFPGQVIEGVLGGLGTALQSAGRSGVGRAAVGLAALPFGGAPLAMTMAPKESLRATGEALSRAGTRAELENRLQAEAIFGKPSEEAQYYPGVRRAQQISQAVGSTIPYIATEGVAGVLGAAGKARTAARAAKAVEAAQAAGAAEMALPAASRLERAARATRAAAYPMAGAQGSQQAGQKAQQFREQGGQVSPEQELAVRLAGVGLGLTEVGVINRMVQGVPSGARGAAVDAVANFVDRATRGKVAPKALMAGVKETIEQVESRALGRMALSGFEESGQEGLVQFGQNLAAQQVYNPNQDLMEGVGESALIGGLVGGGIRGGVEGYRTATGANKQAALEKQYRELQAQPALASFELAVPNPADPAMVTRQAVDVISAPDADGKVVVRYPDGTLARRSVETLEASRVPEGAFYPSDAFSKDMVGGRLTSVLGEKPTKQAVDTADALNRKLNNDIALGDIQASSGYIADLEKRFSGARKAKARQQMTEGGVSAIEDAALRVLYEAKSIVNDYRVEYAKAQAQPGARVGEAAPSPQETIAQMMERNQAGPPTVSNLRFQLQALIDGISTDPDITDKQGAFNEALARTGLGEAIDQQGRTPMEILRAESEAETEAATGMPQLDEQQAAERAAIIDAAVGRTNYTPEEKISLIDAELLRARQDPLTAEEETRVVRRAQAGNVFGPTGEYQQALEAEMATVPVEEGGVPSEATPELPAVAEEVAPAPEEAGVPVTVVGPGEARGVRPVARGTQGTTVGRPVEGAEELTPGMQDIQALTKRLETMRNNNMITDRDVASALSKVREGLSGTQETIDQLFAKREATTNKAERNALTNTIKSLEIKLEEQRSSLAAEAGKAAAKAAGKRRLQMAKVNSDYQTGKITKAERDRRLRAIKVEGHLFPVMSLREDVASELIINPDAEGRPLELGAAEEIAEGTEQILARLDKAVADGDITPEARDFTKWVLNSNPNLTRFAQLYVSKETGQPHAGQYDPISRLIEVVSGSATGTTVHEILHHAERLMPDSAQSAIRGLWETRLNIKRRASQGDAKKYLDLIHDYYFGTGDARNLQVARMLLADGGAPRNLYQFFTPSEFWAENATDILRQRFDVKDSVLGRIRQWLKEFASYLGNFVGVPTRSTIIRQLNQLANTDGTSKSSGLIAGTEGPAFAPKEPENIPSEPMSSAISEDLLKFIDQLETDVNRSKVDRVGIYASLQKMLKPLDGAKSAVTRKINYDLQDAPDTDRWLAQQLGVDRLPDNMSLEAQASVLKSSRSSRQILLDRNYIQPIVSKIAELGLDSQDIGMYLWARSAKDRNAVVRSRNGAFPEAGSGMSDAEAQSYLREFDQAGLTPKLETVAKLHDRLVDYLLNLRVEEGLLTRKQAQAARQLQPFYTPLKGYAAEGDMQDMGDADPHSEPTYRANLGIKRSEYMKTQGRKSMPYNPLYMLVADAKELVNRVAVNRVGLRLLDNLMRDPDLFAGVASYYTDSDPKITYKPNENTEYPDGIPVRHNMRMERGKYLVVKKDGTPYYIEFADTDAGNSARRLFANMQVKQLPLLARAWIRSANFLKSMLTRLSVPYLPTAYLRDIQDAATKAFSAETDIKSPAYGKQFGARVAANITMATPTGRLINSAVRQFAFGLEPKTEEQAEMALLLQQMMEDGGAPGHAVLHDVERLTADAEKQIKRAIALQRNNPVAYATAAPRAIVNTLDAVSQIIDLKARLASYVAALEAGIDRNGAARLALNSSLDLTRRGEWAATLDSIFFFWSPGVESVRQFKRMSLNSSNGRKVIMASMAAGVASALWNMWMGSGDDDEDGRSNYEDIPDGVKQTSLIFMWGPGADDYWRLPLGFMLNFPVYAGQKITEAGAGAISEGAAAISILDSLREVAAGAVTTFSPIKPRGADPSQFVMSFVPNLAKPFVEAYANLNAFGSPIYTPNVTGDRSAASLGREDTGRVWQWLSNSINDMTGGRGTVSGGTDIPPEALRYLFESYAGGTYRAGESAVKLITEDAKQDESLVQRLPIVQSFTGRSERYAAMNNYFKNTTQQYSFPFIQSQPEMDQLVSQEKHEPDIFALTSEDYPLRTSYEVMEAYKEAKRELDRIGRDRRAALAETEDRQARLDILEDARLQKDEVYKVFNRIYNEAAREQRSQ